MEARDAAKHPHVQPSIPEQSQIQFEMSMLQGMVWHRPLTPKLRRQRQAEFCEYGDNLVYIVEFQDSQDYTLRPCHKNKTKISADTEKP